MGNRDVQDLQPCGEKTEKYTVAVKDPKCRPSTVKPGYIGLKNQPVIIRYIEGPIYRVILLSNYPPYF